MTADAQRELAAYLQQRFAPPGPFGFATRDWRIEAEQILALPTVQALIADAEKRAAARALEPVRAMHVAGSSGFCSGCGWTFPCPTAAALDPSGAAEGAGR